MIQRVAVIDTQTAPHHRYISVDRSCIGKERSTYLGGNARRQSRRCGSAGGTGVDEGAPNDRDAEYGGSEGDSMRLLMKKAMPITTRNPPTPMATEVSFDVKAMSTMRPKPTPIRVTPARRCRPDP